MLKWEADLSQTFSIVQWHKALSFSGKYTACGDHWDISEKILQRWFLTTYRLRKIYPSVGGFAAKRAIYTFYGDAK